MSDPELTFKITQRQTEWCTGLAVYELLFVFNCNICQRCDPFWVASAPKSSDVEFDLLESLIVWFIDTGGNLTYSVSICNDLL